MSASSAGTATKRPHRAGVVAGAAVAAFVLSAASVAWACTQIIGQMTVTPDAGPAGTVVNARATGLKGTGAKYKMKFNDATRTAAEGGCHSAPIVLKKGIRTTAQGTFDVNVTIPSNAPLGASQICGLETYPTPGNTGTAHITFTVG